MNNKLLTKNYEASKIWSLLILLWVINLFYPDKLIAYYIPALNIIKRFPTILLLLLYLSLFFNNTQRQGYYWLAFYLFSTILSGIYAFNFGRALHGIVQILYYYFLACISYTHVDNDKRVEKLLTIVILSFLYLSLWGIIGFITTSRGMIPWGSILAEEDAFGPIMCIGFSITLSLYLSDSLTKVYKKFCLMTMTLCIFGVILSFARGAFFVMIAIGLLQLKRSKNLMKILIMIVFLAITTYMIANFVFPENAFWKEMASASKGTQEGTGRDRKVLWSIAWEEFKANPIIGVGAYNFGVVAGNYLHLVPDKRDYSNENIWGRALHNGFLQILCEGGIIGSLIFVMLLLDNIKRTKRIYISISKMNNKIDSKDKILLDVLKAINVGITCFLMNAFFYDIIYYPWLFQLLICSRVIINNINKPRYQI